MPRTSRTLSSIGIYHIILRSVNQHIIFEEDADYQKFLFVLSDCKANHDIELYAYCLMDNHIHLLLYAANENLATFFQSLGTRFVRWYNGKYFRSGHLFQDRYFSKPIETNSAFLAVLMYIHNNPVKANICRYPSEYRWSSYNAFYGQNDRLVDPTYAYHIAGSKEALLHLFSVYDSSADDKNPLFADDHRTINHHRTDEQALSIFRELTGLTNTSEVIALPKAKRNSYIRILKEKNLTNKQIARLMDISVTTVKRLCQSC